MIGNMKAKLTKNKIVASFAILIFGMISIQQKLHIHLLNAPTLESTSNKQESVPMVSKKVEFQYYDDWLQEKIKTYNNTCAGWREYKAYIEAFFATLPEAPDCTTVSSFVDRYNQTEYAKGTFVLRRHLGKEEKKQVFTLNHEQLWKQTTKLSGREKDILELWKHANFKRNMPPSVEMIVLFHDKPRVPPITDYLGLPPFVNSGKFPVGANNPNWAGHLPFPSRHFYSIKPEGSNNKDFLSREPKLTYRGYFSEHCWADSFHNHTNHCNNTARFKLAYGTSKFEDQDVLDVKLTGFARKDAPHKIIQEILAKEYNITVGDFKKISWTDSRYVLAVQGNGWAGTTMYKSMLSGGCTLFVDDKSIDDEGITRELGGIYFPLIRPGKEVVVVDYNTLASTVRVLNSNPKRAAEIAANGAKFGKKYLGMECAADVIELLAWNYYKYVSSGCQNAFSHLGNFM